MATPSTKNYIVNYTVTANTTSASEAITTLGESLSKIVQSAKDVAAAMDKIASSSSALGRIAGKPIIPQLGVDEIKQQAQAIEKIVMGTAQRMNRALYTGITNPRGEQILSRAAQDVTKNSKTIQREIDDLQKSYNKLVGKNAVLSSKNGVPYVRKHDPASDYGKASKAQRENIIQEAKRIQGLISANKQAYDQARIIEDKAAQQLAQTTRQQQQDQRTASKQPITNFAARDLQKIQKFFGNAKSKSFKLNLNADASGPNGALTVYNKVQEVLGGLNGKTYTATINAQLGKGFTDVEKRVAGLAQLAASATLPFAKGSTKLSTDQQKQVKDAQARLKEIKNLQAPIQSRLQKNQAIANPTKGIKGQITKDLRALSGLEAESKVQQGLISSLQGKANVPKVNVPVGVRLVTENIKDSLAKIPKQTLTIHGKMSATQIREAFKIASATLKPTLNVGVRIKATQGQLNQALKGMADKALTAKIPPIALKLDTSLAVEELARFLTYIRMCSPQTIALQASGGGAPGKAGSPATGTKQTGKNAPGSTGHQASRRASSQTTAPSGFNGTKNIYWGGQKPVDELLPKGYHWEQSNQLAPHLSSKQREAFNRVQKLKQQAGVDKGNIYGQTNRSLARLQQLQAVKQDFERGYAAHTQKLLEAQKKYQANQQQLSTLAAQHRQIESLMQPLKAQKKLNKSQKAQLSRLEAAKSTVFQTYQKALGESQPLRNVIAQEESARQAYQAKIDRTQGILDRGHSYVEGRRRGADAAYNRANRAAAKYTEGWAMTKNVEPKPVMGSPSSASLQRRANILGDRSNTVARFTENQTLANAVTKNWRYFAKASEQLNLGSQIQSGNLTSAEQLAMLSNVRGQMTANHVAVPAAINKRIAKLEKGSSGSGGSGSGRAVRGDSYNRFRRDMFPLTGPTSFGSRTPMAVEMAKGMGMMYAVGGAMSAISNSFGQAMEYQNVMETTKAILQHGTDSYTTTKFDNMAHIVREVGVKTKFSAPEVANAAKFLAMAGFDIDAINNSIRPIADIALIGDTDLGETADKMTNVMTTFNIGADQMRAAANIMTTTMTRSNTDLMMLAESAKYGGGIANMYGTGSPLENLSNAMAIFGVMGNAGVQGSSAGTALRMMYMNLYNPNKKQAAFQEQLLRDYGIRMYADDAKTQKRSISDIFIDLAAKVPKNEMADVLSRLFRVTALSGASAVANAAGFSKDEAEGAAAAANGLVDIMTDQKNGNMISQLAQLLKANQASLKGNISGAVAEEKQNTLEGLWAQVTSMFTEGVVRAMEQRQGGFEGILTSLRDYLARPETMQMIGNLIDLIVQVGKVMAWFAEIWANLYNTAPGLIKAWITTQMFFTQVGTLIGPIAAVIGGLKSVRALLATIGSLPLITGLTGAGAATAMASGEAVTAGIATTGAMAALSSNKSLAARKKAATAMDLAANAPIVAGGTPVNKPDAVKHLNEVKKRAARRYTRGHSWAFAAASNIKHSALGRNWMSGWQILKNIFSFQWLITAFKGLMSALAGGLGLILNPVTLAIAGLTALGVGVYHFYNVLNGQTQAQLASLQQFKDLSSKVAHATHTNFKWIQDKMEQFSKPPIEVSEPTKSATEIEYEEQQKRIHENFGMLFDHDLAQDASKQKNLEAQRAWKDLIDNNPLYRQALGAGSEGDALYSKYVDLDFTKSYRYQHTLLGKYEHGSHAKWIKTRQMQLAPRLMATTSMAFQKAHDQITALQAQFAADKITETEYQLAAHEILNSTFNPKKAGLKDINSMSYAELSKLYSADNNTDFSYYQQYQQGGYDALLAEIIGVDKTLMAKQKAYMALKNKTMETTDGFWLSVRQIIGDYPITFNALVDGGIKQIEGIRLALTPDGLVDLQALQKSISEKVEGYALSLKGIAAILTQQYYNLVKAGMIPDAPGQAYDFIRNTLNNYQLTKADIVSWYHDHADQNIRDKYSPEEFTQKVLTPGATFDFGKYWTNADLMVSQIKRHTVQGMIDQALGKAPQLPSMPSVDLTKNDSNDGIGDDKNSDKTNNPYKPDQNDYNGASHYSSAAAKPTVVQISIGTVGHFDHTMIASNAEERDLVQAIEGRVAGALERIIADAQHRANTGYTGYMA